MTAERSYTPADRLFMHLDVGLRTLLGRPKVTERPEPAADEPEPQLDEGERRHVAGLMRVNHAGEVSAQGLYEGQALTARLPEVRERMERAALEENDHLVWCENRIKALGSHVSYLDPVWYLGSLAIGAAAGAAGDQWSLGFVAETEHQVIRHLDDHLARLPERDGKDRAVLEQMKADESHHATTALAAGGADLPAPVKKVMGMISKVMTTVAYRV